MEAAAHRLRRLDTGYSAMVLYLGLKREASELGVEGENYWIFTGANPNDMAGASADLLAGNPRAVYVSFPSLKAGDGRPATAELIALVDPAAFERWQDTTWRRRGADYAALKDRISLGLLKAAETRLTGLSQLVSYSELATPLSIEHFTARNSGRMYGIALTPERLREILFQPKTPVVGLYLSGSDAATLGIVGALMGGLAAACQCSGLRETGRLMGLLQSGKQPALAQETNAPRGNLPGSRSQGVVIANEPVSESVRRVILELPRALPFLPGQYLRLEVAPFEYRDYSIAAAIDRQFHLLINTRFGGAGSIWAQRARPGQKVNLRGPVGDFVLSPGDRPKFFVATGTGIASILAMLEALATRHHRGVVHLLFGCRNRADDFTGPYLEALRGRLALEVTICLSREAIEAPGYIKGRVTDVLPGLPLRWAECGTYVSGNPDMVQDVVDSLGQLGTRTIHTELY